MEADLSFLRACIARWYSVAYRRIYYQQQTERSQTHAFSHRRPACERAWFDRSIRYADTRCRTSHRFCTSSFVQTVCTNGIYNQIVHTGVSFTYVQPNADPDA